MCLWMTSIGPETVYWMVGEKKVGKKKALIFSTCGGVIAALSLRGPHLEVLTMMHHQEASKGSGFGPFRRESMEN